MVPWAIRPAMPSCMVSLLRATLTSHEDQSIRPVNGTCAACAPST
jgi:hypothetical protein